jgi:hypothetical protein
MPPIIIASGEPLLELLTALVWDIGVVGTGVVAELVTGVVPEVAAGVIAVLFEAGVCVAPVAGTVVDVLHWSEALRLLELFRGICALNRTTLPEDKVLVALLCVVGAEVGAEVGVSVGAEVGALVGALVGVSVGSDGCVGVGVGVR